MKEGFYANERLKLRVLKPLAFVGMILLLEDFLAHSFETNLRRTRKKNNGGC